MAAQLGAKFNILQGLDFQTGYAFQYKERDTYSGTVVDSGRYHWECLARIERIRLLQLLHEPYQDEANQVRELVKKLKSPSHMLERLQKILP